MCKECIKIFLVVGKILEDAKSVDSYKIEEKNFVVVMVSKVIFVTLF